MNKSRLLYVLLVLPLTVAVYQYLFTTNPWFAVDKNNSQLLPATGSYFLAWGDFNGDTWPDLWAGLHGDARLLLNRQGAFEDVSAQWGIVTEGDNHGAAWQDFDGDGDQDLIEMLGGGRGTGGVEGIRLYRNDSGNFKDVAAHYGLLIPQMRGRVPLWLDVDNDQHVDLLLTAAGQQDSGSQIVLGSELEFQPAPERYAVKQNELGEYAQLLTGPAQKLYLAFHSRSYPGDVFEFTPGQPLQRAELPGIDVSDVRDSVWADLNGDQIDDLVVARTINLPAVRQTGANEVQVFMSKSEAIAEHQLTFAAASKVTLTIHPHALMWWHGLNVMVGGRGAYELSPGLPEDWNSGLKISLDSTTMPTAQLWPSTVPAIFIDYLPEQARWQIRMVGEGHQDANLEITSSGPISHFKLQPEITVDSQDPRFFMSGAGVYQRMPLAPGIQNCGSVAAADFDNDADLDLFFACGKSLANGTDVVLENDGSGRFTMREESVFGSVEGGADTVVVADYNRDGVLDLAVSNGFGKEPFNLGPVQFFHGVSQGNNWLQVDLSPPAGQLFPTGAQLVLTAEGRSQIRTVGAAAHAGGAHSPVLHYGLGHAPLIDVLELRLPNGEVLRREGILPNQYYRFFQ